MFLLHNYGFRGSNNQYISKRKHNISRDSKNIELSSHTLFWRLLMRHSIMFLISAALYFNVFYKYLSNKKLLRILPCQKFHLS